MKRDIVRLAITLITAALFLSFGKGTAYAAQTRIDSFDISIRDTETDDGLDCYRPVVSSSYVTVIESLEASSDRSAWKPGRAVTITAVLRPADGYVFKAGAKVTVSNGKLASSTVKKNTATVRINYVPKATLKPVENMWVGDDGYTFNWDAVPYCSSYQIELTGPNTNVLLQTSKGQCYTNVAPYITDELNEVTLRIRPVPKSDAEAAYLYAGEWRTWSDGFLPSEDNTVSGYFSNTSRGLCFVVDTDPEDGTRYLAVGWEYIGGRWYYFDSHGYALSGLQNISGKVYYLDPSTYQMLTGWVQLSDGWRYFSSSGSMVKGWIQSTPGGSWYYLDLTTGIMWADRWTPDGYYVMADGRWNPETARK